MTKYNKLVRDKIVSGLKKKGLKPKYHVARGYERWTKIKAKLEEEMKELAEAVDNYIHSESEEDEEKMIEEIADLLEILDKTLRYRGEGVSPSIGSQFKRVLNVMKKKARQKGRFEEEIILDEV